MSLLNSLTLRLRSLFHRRQSEQDLEEELRGHLEMQIEENIRAGMIAAEARRTALLSFGGVEQIKEEYREVRGFPWAESLWQDFRYSARGLVKSPGFTLVAVLTLALGIGANTAIFSVVNALLLHPYTFRDLDQLVLLGEGREADGQGQYRFAPADYLDLKTDPGPFQEVAAFRYADVNLTGVAEPERIVCDEATANFFSMLGSEAAQGRVFSKEEELPGREQVAVVSDSFWKSRLGADRHSLGKTLTLNGKVYTIVGIMPADFKYPMATEIWVPLALEPEAKADRTVQHLQVLGRLKPGLSPAQAGARLRVFSGRLADLFPQTNQGREFHLLRLREEQYQYTAPLFLMLQVAAVFVLVLACANVANIVLARALGRQKEMAIRSALGATRLRSLRQYLTEMILLAALSGAAAVSASFWAVAVIRTSMPVGISMWVAGWDTIRVDRGVLLFAVLLTLLVAVVFGVFSAVRTPAQELHRSLKEGGRSGRGGRARHRLRSALVVSEVALAMVLLAGAALLAKGFLRLVHLYQGLEPANVLSLEVTLPERKYTDDTRIAAYFESLLRGSAELPAVESAGAVRNLPASNVENATSPFTIEGRPSLSAAEMPVADLQSASPDYFRVLRIPLVSGRTFSPGDDLHAPRVALVSRAMAQRFWPGDDPLGKRLQLGKENSASPWVTIVGVVGDVKQNWFEPGLHSVVYLPVAQAPRRTLAVVLRTSASPTQAAAPLRALAQKLDPEIALADVQPMEAVIADALAPIKIIGALMIVFGVVALCLAAVGVYGVLSNSVAQRKQEFGIRMALGAQPGNLRKMVLRQAARLSGAGLAIGLALALAMNRVMASALYGIVDLDFLILAEFASVLGVVALAASYHPAWRATRVDPLVALREE